MSAINQYLFLFAIFLIIFHVLYLTGPRCDQCSDGYYGHVDEDGDRVCKACDCNTNVDVNAVNNCNRTTGECLKCIYNTAGFHCDQCLPGEF